MISALISNRFGNEYVRVTSTDEVIYKCPFCFGVTGIEDSKGHLYVHTVKLVYFCHRCGSKGSLQDDDVEIFPNEEGSEGLKKLLDVLEKSKGIENKYPYYIPSYYPGEIETAYNYLVSRDISEDLQRFYDIRLGEMYGGMFGRIIVPNIVVNTNYTDMYIGRTFIGDKKKYKNPTDSPKSKIVFNLHRIPVGESIIITEGVFSAMSAGKNAVAIYGKFVSDYQLKLILKNDPSTIFVCLDSDAYKEALDLCDKICYNSGVDVRIVKLPEDQDPSDLGHDKFMGYLEGAMKYNKLEEVVQRLKREGRVDEQALGLDK